MYRINEANCKETTTREAMLPEKEEGFFSLDTLLNMTETIATLIIGAGFLLLVAACLSVL